MVVNDGIGGHRKRQAELTRQQTARAARTLFAERGYVATTITAIAEAADIPAPTIYSAFGSKGRILETITQNWMADSRTGTLAAASLAEGDPTRRLRLFAELNRRQLELGSDVIAIYQEAARSDLKMAQTLQKILGSREGEIRKLIDALRPHLAPELNVDSALDACLACTVPEIYRILVAERGWTPERYEVWLGNLLVDQLLPR